MAQLFDLCLNLGDLNLNERLNYVLGQVLGAQDFQKEQGYFLHKSRLQNRSLHGYGTVWGLDVQAEGNGDTLEIQVHPGLAIDTCGREVMVDALQCARLNEWLGQASPDNPEQLNRDALQPIAVEGRRLAVYVILCYRECQTEAQPILGDPCRVDSGSDGVIQYTRIRDDFELKLVPMPPRQHEEDHVRAIGDLLARIEIISVEPGDPLLDQDEIAKLMELLRDALDDPARIPGLDPIVIPEPQSREILREMFRYWVTNTRPTLSKLHDPVLRLLDKITIDNGAAPPADEDALITTFTDALDDYVNVPNSTAIDDLTPVEVPGETATRLRRAILAHWSAKPQSCSSAEDECILLAAVQFALTGDNVVDEGTLRVQNMQRPYLLHTRLLQEMMLRGGIRGPQGEPGTDATIEIAATITGAPGTDADVTDLDPENPSNARLQFTIPRGDPGEPGANATIEIVEPTITGAPGTNANVVNLGTETNAQLQFTIPRGRQGVRGDNGAPGPGLNQLIVRPNDMIPFLEQEGGPLPVLVAGLQEINGYPALRFPKGGVTVFSTLRPNSVPLTPSPAIPPLNLRLYCAGRVPESDEGTDVTWKIRWRWVRAIDRTGGGALFFDEEGLISRPDRTEGDKTELSLMPPMAGPLIGEAARLFEEKEDELKVTLFSTRSASTDRLIPHLSVSNQIELSPGIFGGEFFDYLVVYLSIPEETPVDQVYLLMAELRWKI